MFVFSACVNFSAQAASGANPLTPCEKELSARDVADLIAVPVKVETDSIGHSQPGEGCQFIGGSAIVDIEIRNSNPENFEGMAQFHRDKNPLVGVGDAAYDFGSEDATAIPDARQSVVFARKKDEICQASFVRHNGAQGDKDVVAATPAATAKKLGALCNKVLAGRS